jgi:hypothetical protein
MRADVVSKRGVGAVADALAERGAGQAPRPVLTFKRSRGVYEAIQVRAKQTFASAPKPLGPVDYASQHL